MKKLLSILAAVGMTATAGIVVVACGSNQKDPEVKFEFNADTNKAVSEVLNEYTDQEINVKDLTYDQFFHKESTDNPDNYNFLGVNLYDKVSEKLKALTKGGEGEDKDQPKYTDEQIATEVQKVLKWSQGAITLVYADRKDYNDENSKQEVIAEWKAEKNVKLQDGFLDMVKKQYPKEDITKSDFWTSHDKATLALKVNTKYSDVELKDVKQDLMTFTFKQDTPPVNPSIIDIISDIDLGELTVTNNDKSGAILSAVFNQNPKALGHKLTAVNITDTSATITAKGYEGTITVKFTLTPSTTPPSLIKYNLDYITGMTVKEGTSGDELHTLVQTEIDKHVTGATEENDYRIGSWNVESTDPILVSAKPKSKLLVGSFEIKVSIDWSDLTPSAKNIKDVKIDKITTNEQLTNINSIIQKGIKDQVGVEVTDEDYTFTQGYQVGLTGQTITVNATEDSKLIFGSFTIEVADTHPWTPIEKTIQEKFTENIKYLNNHSLLKFNVSIKDGKEYTADYVSPIQSQLKEIFTEHSQELPYSDISLDGVVGVYESDLPIGSDAEKNGGIWVSPDNATMFFTVDGVKLEIECNYSINIHKIDKTVEDIILNTDLGGVKNNQNGTIQNAIYDLNTINGYELLLSNITETTANVSIKGVGGSVQVTFHIITMDIDTSDITFNRFGGQIKLEIKNFDEVMDGLKVHLEGDDWIKDNGQYVNVALQGNEVIINVSKDEIGFIQEHNFKVVIDSNKAESVEINAHITTDYGFEKGLVDKMHELSADGKLNLYIPSGTAKSDPSFSKAIQAALLNVLKTTDYKDVDLLTSALRNGNYITVNRAPDGKDLDNKEWKWESPKDTTFIFLLANGKELHITAQFNLYVGF